MTGTRRSGVVVPESTSGWSHPLDPLSADEVRRASRIAREKLRLGPSARFAAIRLHEPEKEVVRGHRPGDPIHREAWIVVMDHEKRTLHDGVVSLDNGTVCSWTERPGLRGPLLPSEYDAVAKLVKEHPGWQHAVRRRGIENLDQVRVDAWMIGNFGIAERDDRRMCAALAYLREHVPDLPYARPIEGVVGFVDLDEMSLIEVLDPDPVSIPSDTGRYDPEAVGTLRDDLRPLEIAQPDGPSFAVQGHEIIWQRWHLRWSFNVREGLVLHRIGYETDGVVRSIVYRATISEMVVPYGDVSPAHFWQGAFDVGEFGIGRGVNSLRLGCDCLGLIEYFDVVIHDDFGEPVVVPQAICLHEEDYSILWKHFDFVDGHTQVRRQRRLVLSCICTNLNYEYGYYWYFYLDGTIEFEVKLTGVMQTKALEAGNVDPHAPLVAPGLGAMLHQHLFNVRLDMEVDGPKNNVDELELVAAPVGRDNPWGNAMVTRQIPLVDEMSAQRSIDAATSRSWVVTSSERRNNLGVPTGYRLVPEASPSLLAPQGTPVGRRAHFAHRHLWVTPFRPDELFAAGDYPNQHPGGTGLPQWTAQNRWLRDTDLVLWHTFGLSHVPRTEDWPVMPVERCGFRLKPWGFFVRNPTLDVPPLDGDHCYVPHPATGVAENTWSEAEDGM